MNRPRVQRSDRKMATRRKPKIDLDGLTIGDRVRVNLHQGRFEDAVIKAITPIAGGAKYQVDFGYDETATVREWQIIEKLGSKPDISARSIRHA